MDDNVKPEINGVSLPAKKKTRRGNKGRPKPSENDDSVNHGSTGGINLIEAIRQVAQSQEDLISTAIGPAAKATTSAEPTGNGPQTPKNLLQQVTKQLEALAVDWNVAELGISTTQNNKHATSSAPPTIQIAADSLEAVSKTQTNEEVSVNKPQASQESDVVANGTLEAQEAIDMTPAPKKKKNRRRKGKAVNSQPSEVTAEDVSEVPDGSPKLPAESMEVSELAVDPGGPSSAQDGTSEADQDRVLSAKKTKRKKKPKAKQNVAEVSATANQTVQQPNSPAKFVVKDKPVDSPSKSQSTPKPFAKSQQFTPPQGRTLRGRGTPGSADRNQASPRNRNQRDREDNSFPEYWSKEVIEEKLAKKEIVKGNVRINKKNYREAYVTHPSGGMDILIEGIRNRNRALEGDEIVVQILPQDQWKNQGQGRKLQQTGMVVGILKMEHHRQAVGTLKLDKNNPEFALLSPRDSRVPRIKIAAATCPPNYTTMPEMLYLAEIKKWDNTNFASGTLEKIVGMAGSIETETESILMENGLEVTPYGPEMAKYYPPLPYTIPQEEIDKREDFRKMCIFTIDPATARDLDDAVSYKALPGGECEVGVHISDVSHFLEEGTPLDEMVSSRATTTYLVQSVYHMLPYDMCKLCSLTPGEDKLAFSVLWKVSADGTIGEPRFTRSVLLSCCQMSYEQAQSIIDAPADKNWTAEDLPTLHGGFTPRQVVDTVLGLQPLALKLREGRFQGGALRIDQPKLSFGLDPDTGLPDKFSVYQNMECHRLIEELMLMANMAVAKQLRDKVPQLALLRCHPPPHDHMLPELQRMLAHSNIELDITNSGTVHTSLQKYLGATDHEQIARGWALSALLSKPMARARYFCADGTEDQDQWHYALSVPLYTHFTSPIRRYADVIVHRLLACTLSYSPMPKWHPDLVKKLASNCNGKKYSAKRAGEQSSELYLTLYVGMHGPMKEEAVVVDVKDHSFDVLVLRTGSNHRVYVNNFDSKVATSQYKSVAANVKEITVDWKVSGIKQVIKLFSLVTVRLKKSDTELKIMASLCPPSQQ